MSRVASIRWAVVLSFVAAIELLCRTGVISAFTMPPPSEIVRDLGRLIAAGTMWPDVLFTLENTCAAIAISIVLGFALGAVIQRLRRLRRIVSPLLAAYYAVPAFVFYPLLVVLIGLNRFSLIAIGATLGVVGMIVNTIDGLDRVPRVFKQTAASFRMGRIATLLLIDVPAAAPYLVTGVKLAVTYSITGTIAGEFILSVAGLGRAMSLAYNNLDNATMYGLLLLLLAASTVANLGIHAWEQRMYRRWGHS